MAVTGFMRGLQFAQDYDLPDRQLAEWMSFDHDFNQKHPEFSYRFISMMSRLSSVVIKGNPTGKRTCLLSHYIQELPDTPHGPAVLEPVVFDLVHGLYGVYGARETSTFRHNDETTDTITIMRKARLGASEFYFTETHKQFMPEQELGSAALFVLSVMSPHAEQ